MQNVLEWGLASRRYTCCLLFLHLARMYFLPLPALANLNAKHSLTHPKRAELTLATKTSARDASL